MTGFNVQQERPVAALRTPDACFAALPGFNYPARYGEYAGLRVHYIDEGGTAQAPAAADLGALGRTTSASPASPASPAATASTWQGDAAPTVLCLHGNPSWSYVYRHMIPVFTAAGLRVVAPDLIGFGRSDKPALESAHSFDFHRQMLLDFVQKLDLNNILLVCQDWGGLLGLTLPMAMPERFTRVLVMNTSLATGELSDGFRQWRTYSNSQPDLPVGKLLKRGKPGMTDAEAAAYDAPFPDPAYKAAVRAFPNLVPEGADAAGAATSQQAAKFWRDDWTGSSFMAIGLSDPVLGGPVMHRLRSQIRGCPPPLEIAEAGHFVQEWGGPIAQAALQHFKRLPQG